MTKCIVIFEDFSKCLDFLQNMDDLSLFLSEAIVVLPKNKILNKETNKSLNELDNAILKFENIENIRILNPKLDQEIRQKSMRSWLMPFGFIAGLTFSQMTSLSTFSFLGLNSFGESLLGGLLGMFSGLIGSFFASASININRTKELRSILNLNKEGKWLLILENQTGYEMPWIKLRDSNAKDIVVLAN